LFANRCKFALQQEQLGTAHAVAVAIERNLINENEMCAVIYGDNPLITATIISDLLNYTKESKSAAVTLAFQYDKPNAYGRIVTDEQGVFKKIVESKFATKEEKAITLCNSGIMAFAPSILQKYITKCLEPDVAFPQQELYLTRIIEICSAAGEKVSYFESQDHQLVIGVNTIEELESANQIFAKL
jgi:UDP-N-acetylglucosamine pyrophosphorylase